MSIRFKLALLLTLLFVAAIFNSLFTFQLESFGEEKLRWVNHTHETLTATSDLLGSMKDVETGQRGYLLTGDMDYLDPYYAGLISVESRLIDLKIKTADNADQKFLLKRVDQKLALMLAEFRETVQLAQSGSRDRALEIVVKNEGNRHMEDIQSLLGRFTNTELILLAERKGEFRSNRIHIYTLMSAEVAFFILLAVFTSSFLRRNFFRPLKLLVKSAEKLESGIRPEPSDFFGRDEMGHLLSTFFLMGEQVSNREEALDHKAHHDTLTGLKNRVSLSSDIDESIRALQKTKDKIAVLFLDLNGFKEINDRCGHDFGDLVLKETAGRISSSVRSSDTVYRVGGDEFLVLARNIENISDVHSLVNSLVKTFDEPAVIRGKITDIKISIGVAVAPDNGNTSSELMEFADVAMYAAKREKDADSQMFDIDMLRATNKKRARLRHPAA